MSTTAAHAGVPADTSVTKSRRPSVIWVIPVIAVAIAAWLAYDTLSKRGPTITISFETAEGLQPGQSQLKFKDIVFGTVQSLRLTPDHSHVLVTIATTWQAGPLLSDQTIFWVVKPRLFAGNISGFETLLSGAYIGMLPSQASGKAQTNFVGHEDPPVLEATVPGRVFLVKAKRLGSITLGAPVFFRDLEAGEVLGWDIADMAGSVTIHAFVRAPFDGYVHDESRFWNASGLSVKLGADGVQLQVESLRALLLGGIVFDTPEDRAATEVSVANRVFPLFDNRDAAAGASYSRKLSFVSYFPGSVHGLTTGSEVTTHGLVVGHVTDVRLSYDAATGTVVAPVRYEVEPERIFGIGSKSIFRTPTEAVDTMLKRGLRASLQSGSLITGQQMVTLDFVKSPEPAVVKMEGQDFVMPNTAGGGFEGIETSAAELLDNVNQIPFKQIGASLNDVLHSAADATSGPQLREALVDLAATLASAKDMVGHLDTGLAPASRQFPQIASDLQKTLSNANKLVVSVDSGYGDNTQFKRDLERLLVQSNDALRSIRALADLLARHPEALIKGRSAGGTE
jgi:paraquat-inducible protein B